MAITRDISSGASTTDASSFTRSITVASGNNRRLIVVLGNNDAGVGGPVEATGVTFNGDALTKQVNQGATVSGQNNISIWELVAPDVATGNLVASFAGVQDFIDMGWVVLQGASQLSTPHATNKASSVNTQNPSISATATTDDVWAVSIGYPKDVQAGGTITGATEFMGTFFPDAGYSGPHNAGAVSHTYSGSAATEDWITAMVLVQPVEADSVVARRVFTIS